jgi:tetratricopeptide (TPR) repeat protein
MSAISVIDDGTVAAIRHAVAAASAGRLGDAIGIAERALESGGDSIALNAMLGTLQLRSGNTDAAIQHLREANLARPADTVIATNLANALVQQGAHASALDVLSEDLARSDSTLQLQRLRGFIAQSAEDYPAAVASYGQVVEAEPDDWETWNNLGNAHRQMGDFDAAVAALKRAAELNPEAAPVRFNYATALGNAGLLQEAEHEFRRLADDFPHDSTALSELHAFLKEQGREEDALEAIEQAVAREPTNVELLLGLASHLSSMLRSDAAEMAYRKVIDLQPGNGQANLGLALCFELTNRTTDLANLVGEAEQRGVPVVSMNFIRAFDHRRAKRFAEGVAALELVPEDIETPRRWHLMGQLQEGLGNYEKSFEAYSRMNEIQREDPTRPEDRAANYRATIKSQRESLTEDWFGKWRHESKQDERSTPVFLVGFPRSGTTLLDTMLMGHPDIEVLEEEPTLRSAASLIADFAALPTLSDEKIREARDAYFETAKSLTPLKPGKLLVDKNPLSMNLLPYIYRIFPDAKIILALRHPCDSVFSCHVTNFKLNDGMANFISLETTAELYDLSFSQFERARDLLGMPVHQIRYEDVVEDQERELKALLDFLGLDWSDDVLDHETTALNRGRIKTASYAQVAQPIYRQSAGRWTNFREHLEPVLPVLEPWVQKFGYSL